jgi:hypothetical protein
MIALTIRIALVALSLVGSQVGLAVAAGPPKLDVGPSCDAAVRFGLGFGRNKKACIDDENTARDAIAKSWSQYSADHKTLCVGMVNAGGPPSYVELGSCLEMMKDAAEIRQNAAEDDPLGNPAAQPASRRTKMSRAPMPPQRPTSAQNPPNSP